ncbi:hypothetical protein VTK26DRAFT_9230 [Humicola hyalothermophila]
MPGPPCRPFEVTDCISWGDSTLDVESSVDIRDDLPTMPSSQQRSDDPRWSSDTFRNRFGTDSFPSLPLPAHMRAASDMALSASSPLRVHLLAHLGVPAVARSTKRSTSLLSCGGLRSPDPLGVRRHGSFRAKNRELGSWAQQTPSQPSSIPSADHKGRQLRAQPEQIPTLESSSSLIGVPATKPTRHCLLPFACHHDRAHRPRLLRAADLNVAVCRGRPGHKIRRHHRPGPGLRPSPQHRFH